MTEATPQDRWEARYAATDGYLFGTAPNRFLVDSAAILPPHADVLCVADGEGRNGVFLATLGHKIHAVEFAPTAIAKAQRLAAQRGVTLCSEQVDVLRWTWPRETYDAVVAIFVQFVPPASRPVFFANMVAALRPGGVLIMQGYRPEQVANGTGGPSDPAQCYTEPLLRESFSALTILHLHSHDAVIEEGAAHAGQSALIDLIARKT
jgi:SAM-dependent methyltransferase